MDPKIFYGKLKHVNLPPEDSEDSDLSDEDDNPNLGQILAYESDFDEASANQNPVENETIITETDYSCNSSGNDLPLLQLRRRLQGNGAQTTAAGPSTTRPKWVEGNLFREQEDILFTGSENLPDEILSLDTPVNFFRFLFPKDLVKFITDQTNLYSVQQCPNRPLNVKDYEIKQFIGICLYTYVNNSVTSHKTLLAFLNRAFCCEQSYDMSCNRFEEIKRFLHFNNNANFIPNGQPGHDKLFKVRPFLSKIRERLLLVPKEEHMAVDEKIIPTKARISIKQYNPKKPHKWGYKNFVLSGISGFSYDFDNFAGAQSNVVPPNAPNLESSSNVVLRLSDTIPKDQNFKLLFDNWFSGIPLVVHLTKQGILPLAAVRANRVAGCDIPKEKDMKRKGSGVRGAMVEKVSIIDGTKISVVSWYDNKVVTTMSSYVGSKPLAEKKKFFKSENTHKMIPCPQSVLVYNSYMGGVDLLDSMLEIFSFDFHDFHTI